MNVQLKPIKAITTSIQAHWINSESKSEAGKSLIFQHRKELLFLLYVPVFLLEVPGSIHCI